MEMNQTAKDLKVTLSGVTLQNPVVPASGCFGFGYGMAEFYDIDILGSISFKGTTRDARFGNPSHAWRSAAPDSSTLSDFRIPA